MVAFHRVGWLTGHADNAFVVQDQATISLQAWLPAWVSPGVAPIPWDGGHARQGHPSAAALLTFDLNVIVQIGRERGAVPSESELCLASVSPCVTKLVYSA